MPTTTKFIWDEQNYLAEADGTDTINVVYTNEPQQYGNLISTRTSGTTSYHHFDALGSTRQLTDTRAAVTDTLVYDAWGNVLSHVGPTATPLLWIAETDYYYDVDLGGSYVRRRVYWPAVARWTSFDLVFDERNRNRFSYVANACTRAIDPSGLDEMDWNSGGGWNWFDYFMLIVGGPLEFGAHCCKRPESPTILISVSPDGGNSPRTDTVGIASPEGWELGKCGAFRWQNAWVVAKAPGDAGAYVLQHVITKVTLDHDCSGKSKTVRSELWETFPIPANKFVASKIDTWKINSAGTCTKGSVSITATYGLVNGPIPPVFVENNPNTPNASGGGGRATDKDPKIAVLGEAVRSWSSKWDCCPARKR